MHVFGTLPHKLSCAIHEIRFPGMAAQRLFERCQDYPGQFKSPGTEQSSMAHCSVLRTNTFGAHRRKRDRLYRFFRYYRTRNRPTTRRHSFDPDDNHRLEGPQYRPGTASFMDLIYPSSHALHVPIKQDSPLMIEYSRSRLWLGSSIDSASNSAVSPQSALLVSPYEVIRSPSIMPTEPTSPSFMPFTLHSPMVLPTFPPPPPVVDPTFARGIMTLEHNESLIA